MNRPPDCRRPITRRVAAGAAVLAWLGVPLVAAADLVSVVAAAKGSVVAVGTYDPLASPRFSFRGTGFVVGDGLQVVTNFHVLPSEDNPPRLAVLLPKGAGALPELREVSLKASAADADLALLQLQGSPLPALALSSRATVPDGLAVALIGFPLGAVLGMVPVTHRGIVGATTAIALPPPSTRQLDAKTLNRLRQGPFEVYQLDVTAYPGNSGSPVLDADTGQVLGVLNSVFIKGTKESALTAPSGISYAIPVRHVRALLGAP